MITETRAKLTTAELIAELDRLADERIEALRKAGIEPFAATERSSEEQRRAGRAIFEWRRRRLDTRKEGEG